MSTPIERPRLPEGLVAFVKRDCPTCELVVPVLEQLAGAAPITVFTQDDPAFPSGLDPVDETALERSWHYEIETVPTLLRIDASGAESGRCIGWARDEWEALSGLAGLGPDLPERRPGCGSLSVDPVEGPRLEVRMRGSTLRSRRVELAGLEDEFEAAFERGWTDGLPVIPPTEMRVLHMLEGTKRDPQDVVAVVPPDLVPCTVEKVAINAVMAGCKPEYMPVVLAAVEAICTDAWNIHGVLATTMPVGPVIVVNGPIRRAIGMNSGINCFGQGNRANSTIGRAVQLVVRNVGGGRPGDVDRATFGNPGKHTFCFAEDEEGSPWGPLAEDLGGEPGTDQVTVFCGEGPRSVVDQISRDPESLARSLAANLRTIHHPKLVLAFDAILAIGPEHARVFREAGWTKARVKDRIRELLTIPAGELRRGAGGIAEGLPLPEETGDLALPKFKEGGLHVVHCGGRAGLFSAIIGGWLNGAEGSQIVRRTITG